MYFVYYTIYGEHDLVEFDSLVKALGYINKNQMKGGLLDYRLIDGKELRLKPKKIITEMVVEEN